MQAINCRPTYVSVYIQYVYIYGNIGKLQAHIYIKIWRVVSEPVSTCSCVRTEISRTESILDGLHCALQIVRKRE